ncbi:MAG: hypothetical protein IPJ84_18235 [Bdellovibrionales bacterium]|nr:hypothetical protein [Bdellovibrionales bacterium]
MRVTRFATAVVLVFLIVAFQNCSNARFIQSMTGISGKGLGPAAVVGLDSNGTPLPATPGGVADQTVAAALAECNALQAQAATLPLVAVNESVVNRRGILTCAVMDLIVLRTTAEILEYWAWLRRLRSMLFPVTVAILSFAA